MAKYTHTHTISQGDRLPGPTLRRPRWACLNSQPTTSTSTLSQEMVEVYPYPLQREDWCSAPLFNIKNLKPTLHPTPPRMLGGQHLVSLLQSILLRFYSVVLDGTITPRVTFYWWWMFLYVFNIWYFGSMPSGLLHVFMKTLSVPTLASSLFMTKRTWA